jgi:hypothetical protein
MDKAVHRLDVDRHQNRFNSHVGWMVHTGSQPGRAKVPRRWQEVPMQLNVRA